MQEISEYVQDDVLRTKMDRKEKQEKNRDRVEKRTAFTTTDIDWMSTKAEWKNLRCIGALHTEVVKGGKKTSEWHYYVSSRNLSAEELLRHARMEWAVETMHWLLNVHFDEDSFRAASQTTLKNMNLLRKFSLAITKQYKGRTQSKRPLSKIMLDCLLHSDHIPIVIFET